MVKVIYNILPFLVYTIDHLGDSIMVPIKLYIILRSIIQNVKKGTELPF